MEVTVVVDGEHRSTCVNVNPDECKFQYTDDRRHGNPIYGIFPAAVSSGDIIKITTKMFGKFFSIKDNRSPSQELELISVKVPLPAPFTSALGIFLLLAKILASQKMKDLRSSPHINRANNPMLDAK
jgi:hypothetical protein